MCYLLLDVESEKVRKTSLPRFPYSKTVRLVSNCVRLRPTGHLVTGNRYHVDSGTGSTYLNSYRILVLDTGSNSVTFFMWSILRGAHKLDRRKLKKGHQYKQQYRLFSEL